MLALALDQLLLMRQIADDPKIQRALQMLAETKAELEELAAAQPA